MTIASRLSLLLPLGLLLLLGCGEKKGAVARLSGTVKYKGTPVTAGTITFTAKGEGGNPGGTYPVPITPDGTYSASQLPAGELAVAIETESANPKSRKSAADYGGGKDMMKRSPMPEGVGGGPKGTYVKIPDKYKDPKTSGLTVTVTNGKNTKDFDLTD
jgi:hypothetical protein